MEFDYSNLIGKIITVCKSRKQFAKQMGMSGLGLANKLSGKTCFNQNEISKAVEVLGIRTQDIPNYFFNIKN